MLGSGSRVHGVLCSCSINVCICRTLPLSLSLMRLETSDTVASHPRFHQYLLPLVWLRLSYSFHLLHYTYPPCDPVARLLPRLSLTMWHTKSTMQLLKRGKAKASSVRLHLLENPGWVPTGLSCDSFRLGEFTIQTSLETVAALNQRSKHRGIFWSFLFFSEHNCSDEDCWTRVYKTNLLAILRTWTISVHWNPIMEPGKYFSSIQLQWDHALKYTININKFGSLGFLEA